MVHDLNESFLLKDPGSLHFSLRIEAFRDQIGLYLTQSKYIVDLLQKTKMDTRKPLPTPITFKKTLSKSDGDPLENPSSYRSTIGALQYVTVIRHDVSYLVSKLSLQRRSTGKLVKRVLCYLKGTIIHGLHF